jgi:flagellar basal body-associated protein FliL
MRSLKAIFLKQTVGISLTCLFSGIVVAFLSLFVHIYIMSENPEGRTTDSKKTSKANIEESPEPIAKTDPTEPVTVGGGAGGSKGESKGTTM